jgi:choline dehydrogenase-like flavoprotein
MFNSIYVTLPRAAKTKFFTLRPNAMVREVTLDAEGKARGVVFVDRLTHETHEVSGKTVVLGASCLESTRILLNSKSRGYPQGLANSSGLLGLFARSSHDRIDYGFAPQLYNAKVVNATPSPAASTFHVSQVDTVEEFRSRLSVLRGSGARMFQASAKGLANCLAPR